LPQSTGDKSQVVCQSPVFLFHSYWEFFEAEQSSHIDNPLIFADIGRGTCGRLPIPNAVHQKSTEYVSQNVEFQKAKWKADTDTSQGLYKEPGYLDANSDLCDAILPTHPSYLVFGDIR